MIHWPLEAETAGLAGIHSSSSFSPMITPAIADISHAIQLAVAPVFLLTGIAGLLSVMTNRLARIIDRGRWFEQRWAELDAPSRVRYGRELAHLERRRRLASQAINGCTAAALLVCLVIATLFVEGLFAVELRGLAAVLFIAAMVGLIAGLSLFLREVHLATYAVRVQAHLDGKP
jgi:hypothetical protein